VRRRTPPLGRTTGIEDPHFSEPRRVWHMGVAVHNGVTARKRRRKALSPTGSRTRHVNDPDANVLDLHDPPLGQVRPQRGLVHVPHHSLHRRELTQPLEHADADEVARMENEIGRLQTSEALGREAPGPPRHVRVGDDRDEGQPSVPFRNAPSR
jgi:hypothetical protein